MRAEREGACWPLGRTYGTTVIVTNSCGNSVTSGPLSTCVWHDRSDPPPPGSTIYSANPGSNQNDTRAGLNGTYGAGCGQGCGATCGSHSASDIDMTDLDRDRDGVLIPQDNCPDVWNPGQENSNAAQEAIDPQGDACDSSDALVDTLHFATQQSLIWPAEGGAESYRVYRGEFATRSLFTDATCLGRVWTTAVSDSARPSTATHGFYYLVTTVINGVEGGLGTASNGTPRRVAEVCP